MNDQINVCSQKLQEEKHQAPQDPAGLEELKPRFWQDKRQEEPEYAKEEHEVS